MLFPFFNSVSIVVIVDNVKGSIPGVLQNNSKKTPMIQGDIFLILYTIHILFISKNSTNMIIRIK